MWEIAITLTVKLRKATLELILLTIEQVNSRMLHNQSYDPITIECSRPTLGQKGAESPQIIIPWKLFPTNLPLSFTLLWKARSLQKLQSWNFNMLCKQTCSFCPSCLGTFIEKILEKKAVLVNFLGSFREYHKNVSYLFHVSTKNIRAILRDFQNHSRSSSVHFLCYFLVLSGKIPELIPPLLYIQNLHSSHAFQSTCDTTQNVAAGLLNDILNFGHILCT